MSHFNRRTDTHWDTVLVSSLVLQSRSPARSARSLSGYNRTFALLVALSFFYLQTLLNVVFFNCSALLAGNGSWRNMLSIPLPCSVVLHFISSGWCKSVLSQYVAGFVQLVLCSGVTVVWDPREIPDFNNKTNWNFTVPFTNLFCIFCFTSAYLYLFHFTHKILLIHKCFNVNTWGLPNILWDYFCQTSNNKCDIRSLQITFPWNMTSIHVYNLCITEWFRKRCFRKRSLRPTGYVSYWFHQSSLHIRLIFQYSFGKVNYHFLTCISTPLH